MSELKIMSPQGQYLDICDSQWYQRRDDDTWFLIDPLNDVRVRHGSNQYWLPILCNPDVAYCPPEALQKCWPGHTGNFDGGEFKTGGVTGYLVCDCNGTDCKTYTGHTPDYNVTGGKFFATSPIESTTAAHQLPVTFFGSLPQVSEMLVYAGVESGFITVSIDALDPGVRVRIYNDCELIGDSKKSGAFFNVFFNAAPLKATEKDCGEEQPANNFLTVRVDTPGNARWRVKLGAVGVEQATHYQRPAPCYGTFSPSAPCLVDDNNVHIPGVHVYEMLHSIPTNGTIRLDLYAKGEGKVKISAIYNSRVIATLTTANSESRMVDTKTLTFAFSAVGGDRDLIIRYECERENNTWFYAIYCPDQKGSRTFPQAPKQLEADALCKPMQPINPAFAITGRGAVVNDSYIDLGNASSGETVIEFSATDDVKFLVYQGTFPNEVLIGSSQGYVSGTDRFTAAFDAGLGSLIHVRVLGPCCPSWTFTASNPIPPPILNIGDASTVRGRAGTEKDLCFPVTLTNVSSKPVTFTWQTTPLSALESTDGSCTITEGVATSPYCNFTPTGTAQDGNLAYNDADIGYPEAQRIASSLHDINCAPAGQYYVLETDFEFPYTGDYTVVGLADDNLAIFIDCELKNPNQNFNGPARLGMVVEAGMRTMSFMYQNVPECTPGWIKLVILDAGSNVIFATNLNRTWRSKSGAITVEPPQVPTTYSTDYKKSGGTFTIPACTRDAQICVPVCGTDIQGPSVTFQITISELANAGAGDLVAIGTIGNDNKYECDQNTAIEVRDNGPDGNVNRGAHGMYINKLMSNSNAAYVMDMKLNISVSGVYTFVFYGQDGAELFVDCSRIAGSNSGAVSIKSAMNVGEHHLIITYTVGGGKLKRKGYAALAVIDPLNQVVYASQAADWRGRVINAGNPPMCDQFPSLCSIVPTGTAIALPQYGDSGLGYGVQMIQSTTHPIGCAPANTFYTLEQTMNFPVTGVYTFVGLADDNLTAYIDCVQFMTTPDLTVVESKVHITAGEHLVTVSYKNVPECTPGCAGFYFLKPDNSLFYASAPQGWVSNVGTLTAPLGLGETYQDRYGLWTVHLGDSIFGTGTDYAWWSAELNWNCPEDGNYYATGVADDSMELFVGCQQRDLAGAPFFMDAGSTKIHVRVYNRRARDENWFHFNIFKADGTLVYTSRKDGWRAKMTDLDFTGMS